MWVGTEPHRIHFEVLSYDPARKWMRVRCKNGVEYERRFDTKMKYNRMDYKLVMENSDA